MAFVPDPKQLEAIEHAHSPMLVLAGAGTGKTSVLVERIARLVREGLARPEEILAVTFTKKAAREMRERVEALLGRDCSGLRASNFHAYCEGLLQRTGKNFGILTDHDLWIYLRQRIQELPLERFARAASPGEFLFHLLEFFARCQDELVAPADYDHYLERLRKGEAPLPRVTKSKKRGEISDAEALARCEEIGRVFRKVEEMLARDNLGTFGAQIVKVVELLRQEPALLTAEQVRARFILVDEFQDCNLGQIELIALLAGEGKNVFAVGDPDQAIYRFRGASSAAFDEFLERFPGARTVTLEKNHRSTAPILACAAGVIAKNPPVVQEDSRLGRGFERRPLCSARQEEAKERGATLPSPPVAVVLAGDIRTEAAEVAETIQQWQKESGCEWSRFAVLYRTHTHREAAIEEFGARGIPAAVKGVNVLDTGEVRDLMAVLRAVNDPRDSVSLFRVAALPQFDVPAEAMRDRLQGAEKGTELTAVLERLADGKRVLAALEELRAQAAGARMRAAATVELAVAHFRLERRPEPLAAFRRFVGEWEQKPIAGDHKLATFLAYMDYFPEAKGSVLMYDEEAGEEDRREGVRLMTVHAAKGLEFKHVFVLRANPNSFPVVYREPLFEFPRELRAPGSVALGESKEIHQQEERRLFYVAMTRAKDSLTLCARPGRKGTLNGFVGELESEAALRPYWRQRGARDYRADILAAAASSPTAGVGAWFGLPPRKTLEQAPLSATAIERYQTCPLQFKISREWALPGKVAANMQFGNAVHTVLKGYYDALRAGRPMSLEELVASFREALRGAGLEDEVQRRLYEKQGITQLRAFAEARAGKPAPEVLETEKKFEVRIGGVRVTGRVDRLDRIAGKRVAVVDYKTGKRRDQQDADQSLQLSIYALAVRDAWQLEPERLVLHNLEGDEEIVTRRSPEKLREAEAKVAEVVAGIAAGDFEPNPGYHCQRCDYRELCPATEPRLYTIEPSVKAGVN